MPDAQRDYLKDIWNAARRSTLGQLDDEAKFYLMSRGLSLIQAERLVVLGFLGEVLAKLPLGGVVDKVTRVIEQKLAQHS